MREFVEEPITRDDRFQREMFVALIEEIQLLREEIKALKGGTRNAKRKTNAESRSDSGNAE